MGLANDAKRRPNRNDSCLIEKNVGELGEQEQLQ